jgi:hypothetical protein
MDLLVEQCRLCDDGGVAFTVKDMPKHCLGEMSVHEIQVWDTSCSAFSRRVSESTD